MKIKVKENVTFTHSDIRQLAKFKNFDLMQGVEKVVYLDPKIEVDNFKFDTQEQAFNYLNDNTKKYKDKLTRLSKTHNAKIILPLERYKLDILIFDQDVLLAGDTENCLSREYGIDEHSSNNQIQNVEMFTYLCGFTFYRSGEHFYFTNIDKYIEFIENLPFISVKLFYHNLSYDSAFHMHDLLLKYNQEFTPTELVRRQRRVLNTKNKPVRHEKIRDEIKYIKSDIQSEIPYTMKIAESEMTKYFINTKRYPLYVIKKKKININEDPSEIDWKEVEVSEVKIQSITYSDFYKLLANPLEKVAKMVGVPKFLQKIGNYDYKKIRLEGDLTQDDFDYFFRDIYILDKAMQWTDRFKITYGNNKTKSMLEHVTSAEFALKYWENIIKSKYDYYSLDRKMLITEDEKLEGEKVRKFKVFQKNPLEKPVDRETIFLLPILEPSIDDDLRKSYYGGYVHVAPKYKGKRVKSDNNNPIALSVDRTSMYPSEMISNPMPVGYPTWYDNLNRASYNTYKKKYKKDKLRTFCILIDELELKKAKKGEINIPTVMPKGFNNFHANKYIVNNIDKKGVQATIRLFLNELDLQHLLKNYNVSYEIMGHYEFDVCNNLFDDYILSFARMKQYSTSPAERDFSKIMLNQLYGKYASRTDKKDFEYENVNGLAKKKEKQKYKDNPIYTPMSSWITTYSRHSLFNLIYAVGDKFYYCDTDSVHAHLTLSELKEKTESMKCKTRYLNEDNEYFEGEKPLVDYLNEKYLCGWKVEQLITDFKALKPKTYIEDGFNYEDALKNCFMYDYMEKEKSVKGAGVKANILKSISNLDIDESMQVFNYCNINEFDVNKYKVDDKGFIYMDEKRVPGIFVVEKVFNCRKGKTFVPRFTSIFE